MAKQTKLKSLRRYHNISQEKMAYLLKIHERTYAYKENGDSEFKLNELLTISRLFKKPIEEIFLFDDFTLHEEIDEIV